MVIFGKFVVILGEKAKVPLEKCNFAAQIINIQSTMIWKGKEYGIAEIVLAITLCVVVFVFVKGCHDKNERIWELEQRVEQREKKYIEGYMDGYRDAQDTTLKFKKEK